MARAAGPIDVAALAKTAAALLPKLQRNQHSGPPMLNVAVASGPTQRVLRPAELEKPALLQALHQQALFGSLTIFDSLKGMSHGIQGTALYLQQESGARIQLDEHGALALRLLLEKPSPRGRSNFGFSAVIEEVVVQQLTAALAFTDWTLEQIDPTQRLTHVAVAVTIEAGNFMGWRTRAEQDASPTSGTVQMGNNDDLSPVQVDRARAALRFDAQRLAEDLMVPLRRQRKVQGY